MPNSNFAQIKLPLDIPQVKVLSTHQTKENQFIIKVESRKEITKCGVCKKPIPCNYGKSQEIRLRHLPILGQETYIDLKPLRAKCPACLHNPTTTQILNWYEQRSPHTKAYDQYLMKQLIGSSVMDVSLKEKVGYEAILGALKRQVDSELNWEEVENIGTIGIDEVAHKKGRKHYRAVISARQDDGTVIILAVLNDRKKRVSRSFS